MKRIVVFALVLNAALLGVIAHQLVAIAGGGAVATENGDTNGDGSRDITDAVYLLSWLFTGGDEPVALAQQGGNDEAIEELREQVAELRTNMDDLQAREDGCCEQDSVEGLNFTEGFAGSYMLGTCLRGAILSGVDMGYSVLVHADLRRADLRGADMVETDLRNADLRLANLMGANLRRTNFSEADLRGSLVDSNGDGRPDLVLGGPEAEGIEVDIRFGEDDCTGIVILTGGGDGCLQGIGVDLNGDGTVDVYTVDVAEARAAIWEAQTEPAEAGGEGAGRVEGPGERLAEECVDGTVDLLDVLRVLVGESAEPGGWNIPRWHIENL